MIFENFRRFDLFFFSFSFSFSFLLMCLFQPSILDKFLLFEGGNDGLLYVHFAHLIVENLVENISKDIVNFGDEIFPWIHFGGITVS